MKYVFMILSLLLALVTVAQAGSSSPVPSIPPSPGTSIPCDGKCLAGIAIGDDKYRVLAKLDSRPLPDSDTNVRADFNSYPDGLMLTVYYEKSVVAVSVTNAHAKTRIVDPYGVTLQDTPEKLTALRGKPDSVDGNVWRYGSLDGVHWDYTIENGVITAILLSSVPKLI